MLWQKKKNVPWAGSVAPRNLPNTYIHSQTLSTALRSTSETTEAAMTETLVQRPQESRPRTPATPRRLRLAAERALSLSPEAKSLSEHEEHRFFPKNTRRQGRTDRRASVDSHTWSSGQHSSRELHPTPGPTAPQAPEPFSQIVHPGIARDGDHCNGSSRLTTRPHLD